MPFNGWVHMGEGHEASSGWIFQCIYESITQTPAMQDEDWLQQGATSPLRVSGLASPALPPSAPAVP